jgi:glycosyltransferase involved in cell wall biosynthesis
MRLLIHTQIVDHTDPALGFFHQWIKEFAEHAETIHVVCLKAGAHALPHNVSVHSLGKEGGASRLTYLWRLYRYTWKYRHDYDAVFVHMNPEYVVLCGLLWRLLGKRIGLWYTHRTVDLKLRIAAVLMHHGFTGSVESFNLKNKKIIVTGQGVDTELFVPGISDPTRTPTIVCIGRLSPIKKVELAIEAFALLRKRMPATLRIVGAPAKPEDASYAEGLRALVEKRGLQGDVIFTGGTDAHGVLGELQAADIFLHTSQTNSADKSIIEAMACGVYPITSSPVYRKDLPSESVQPFEPRAYADAMSTFLEKSPEERRMLADTLRQTAIKSHSLARLITWITSVLRGT